MAEINSGVYVTMVTPYNRDGSVDYGAAADMVDFYAENGCDGIFASCQSSEVFFLTLEERVKLAETVSRRAAELKNRKKNLSVVASGHISDDAGAQTQELRRMASTGAGAIVLITNRLDINNTSDSAWINEAARLIETLPEDVPLGLYECPYPYKRLMSDGMIKWCIRTGRFNFLKDTCCDAALISHRMSLMRESGFSLYNANAQTLFASLEAGARGYCGVMANFHPKLYQLLWKLFYSGEKEKAKKLQSFICMAAFTEGLAYPLTAKYHLGAFEGIKIEPSGRTRKTSDLTEYQKDCVRQMKIFADTAEELFGVEM